MSLLTAHKILIATAIGFFVLYGSFELRNFADSGDFWGALRGVAGFAAACGWFVYFRRLKPRVTDHSKQAMNRPPV